MGRVISEIAAGWKTDLQLLAATLANVRNNIQEPGIARFDFMSQLDAPNWVMWLEVYRTPEDVAKHKETPHYKVWRDAVAHMMAEPRSTIKFSNIAPGETGWNTLNL